MTQSAQQSTVIGQSTAIRSILLKSLLGLSFAAVLALAPAPAFAQHGGGGGGGGSHGGGGGGGSHGSSGGGHPSSGSGSHATSNATSSGSSSGHWWNPFHGSGTNGGTAGKGGGSGAGANAASASATTRYAAGNNTWQEPPVNTHTNTQSHFYANSNRSVAISDSRTLHRMTNNGAFGSAGISQNSLRRRPVIFFPFNPFGFGFGSPFGFGFGFGCDPVWDFNCPLGYGFGYGGGF